MPSLLALVLITTAATSVVSAEPAMAGTGDRVAQVAAAEYGNSAHNHETDGCNYYAGQLYGTDSGCPSGWGTGDWCADFAKWVWRQAGGIADVSSLDSYAQSFKNYGTAHGTWHAAGSGYTARPGDAIVYDDTNGNGLADHVGLVVSNSGGTLVSIEGNWGYVIARRTSHPDTQGYTSPVLTAPDRPAVIATGQGYAVGGVQHIYGQGADNSLQQWAYTGSWSVTAIPGTIGGQPVSYVVAGVHHVYARAADGILYHWWYTSPGSWQSERLGGVTTAGVPTAYYAAGTHHVYARGTSGALYHWWYTAGSGAWQSANLGGAITDDPVAYFDGNAHHVYARGTNGALYHWWYDGSTWQLASLGGAITGTPTAYFDGDAHHVYARGTNGALYHYWYDNGAWRIASLGGVITDSAVAYYAGGAHHVYARGTNGALYHWWYDGTGWELSNLGGAISGSPVAAYYADGAHQVYGRGTNGALYHWWYDNGTWSGPVSLGGDLHA